MEEKKESVFLVEKRESGRADRQKEGKAKGKKRKESQSYSSVG